MKGTEEDECDGDVHGYTKTPVFASVPEQQHGVANPSLVVCFVTAINLLVFTRNIWGKQ